MFLMISVMKEHLVYVIQLFSHPNQSRQRVNLALILLYLIFHRAVGSLLAFLHRIQLNQSYHLNSPALNRHLRLVFSHLKQSYHQ